MAFGLKLLELLPGSSPFSLWARFGLRFGDGDRQTCQWIGVDVLQQFRGRDIQRRPPILSSESPAAGFGHPLSALLEFRLQHTGARVMVASQRDHRAPFFRERHFGETSSTC